MVVGLMIAAAGAAQSGLISQATSPPPPIAVVATPPPPIIAVPSAPMPPMLVSESFPKIANVTVRIRALAGRAVLLDDRFRLGRSWASFSQNRSEAAEQSCPSNYDGQSVRSSFSMSLRPQGMGGGKYHLSTSWQRPSGSCEEQGTRSVSLEQSVALKPGQMVVVEGDGGLRVEITQL